MNLEALSHPTDAEILALVSVAEIKENLRILHSREDDRIRRAILDAYSFLSGRSGWFNRTILTQTWRLWLPGFQNLHWSIGDTGVLVETWSGTDRIELPLPPLQSVDSVRYYDEDGDLNTLYEPAASAPVTTSVFRVNTTALFGTLYLANLQVWPNTLSKSDQAVEVIYTAGYGTAAEIKAQERGICRTLAVLAADYYQNPTDTFVEPRAIQVNRKVINGMERAGGRYRIFNNHG